MDGSALREQRLPSAAVLFVATAIATATAAELRPATVTAFEQYVRLTESRRNTERGTTLLWIDRVPAAQRSVAERALRRGEVLVDRQETLDGARPIAIPSGLVHHWIATVFIRGATLADTVALAQDYDHHAQVFTPAVARSRTVEHADNRFVVAARFVQKKVITVVTDVDSVAHFDVLDPSTVEARVYATRIAEVESAFTPSERVVTPGTGRGFLWRMNTYCRFVARDRGVFVEFESVTLSRDLPAGIGWLIRPFVTSVPKDSLVFTLETYLKQLQAS
jgi:hypothetical protein